MVCRLNRWLRSLAQRPTWWVPAAALVAAAVFLAWLGGSALWVRSERAKAEQAIAEYDFAEARRHLTRCTSVRPSDPDLRLLAARTARRDGDLEGARRELDAYRLTVGESTPAFVLERQLIAAQQGRLKAVIPDLLEALEIRHPQSELILEALAIGSVHNYQLAQARLWTDELLLPERNPRNAIGRFLRAQTIDTQGNREKAIGQLQDLGAEFPRYYPARLALADILFKSQRYREAVVEYAALRQQRPGEMLPLLGLASSYDRVGEVEVARPLMRELAERFGDNSEALLECGRFAMGERDPARAEPFFRRAVELAPYDHEVHREFAICLDQLDKPEESRRHLERFRQIEADLVQLEKVLADMGKAPNDPGPRREAGEICLRNGQVAEGLRWLYAVLDTNPDDPATHQILADYFASRGDAERASEHRRKATGPF